MASQEKIQQLQIIEQNLSNIAMQKQQFQNQLFEIDNALKELEKSGQSFKIIGNVMVETKREELQKDLGDKREISELRIQTFEKQEKSLQDQAKKLQEEVLSEMKKNENPSK